jgi:dTDP-glucose pyrophosphorylase
MADDIIGLVPAAGKGVRLGLPYPKELYPVIREDRYRPIAQFVLDGLVASGVKDVVFVINETKHQLIGYFGDGHRFGCHTAYVVQEPTGPTGGSTASTSPGLAHALDAGYHLVKDKIVFFGMADTIVEPHDAFARAWREAGAEADLLLILFPTTLPHKFGMVRSDGRGRVLAIEDKPTRTTLTHMWGCIIWRPVFTEHLHASVLRGQGDFADILNGAIGAGLRARGYVVDEGLYMDLGTYDEVRELESRLRRA